MPRYSFLSHCMAKPPFLSPSAQVSPTKYFLDLLRAMRGARTQRHRANCDRAANTTMNVLPITDLRDRRSRNAGNLFSVIYESHLVLVNEQMEGGTCLYVGQRTAVISDLIAVVAGDEGERNGDAQQCG